MDNIVIFSTQPNCVTGKMTSFDVSTPGVKPFRRVRLSSCF